MVVVTVEDQGGGVPTEERELVFEQFHRGRNFRESTISGYGLGLSISRRIVEAHGGQLLLEPAPGGGTRAVMRLPMGHPRPVEGEAT
jgi:signal transduction histidine kinase